MLKNTAKLSYIQNITTLQITALKFILN